MVIPFLSFSRRGLLDFVVQRVSAFIMAAYVYIQRAHLEFIPGLANFSTAIRFSYQVVCLLVMSIYLIWAMKLIWQF